ncbi:hypothetical protein HZF24_01610 [Sedimentibacter hydroxybenzoicus DSM 7310]|uniref:Uncharacterized protein n=1 Tax=Sedimentibacter hydroxybenzoicus DSM 7310 TaxID=1123245 RepID=A0A974GUZ7_SEDHY|nr:hypothetical protein [Sedimentibacter hydroxybenzoicus DSM 7310]
MEKTVVSGYKNIEKGVVDGYKKIEESVVNGYKKIENKFVETFLTPYVDTSGEKGDDETIRQAPERSEDDE